MHACVGIANAKEDRGVFHQLPKNCAACAMQWVMVVISNRKTHRCPYISFSQTQCTETVIVGRIGRKNEVVPMHPASCLTEFDQTVYSCAWLTLDSTAFIAVGINGLLHQMAVSVENRQRKVGDRWLLMLN